VGEFVSPDTIDAPEPDLETRSGEGRGLAPVAGAIGAVSVLAAVTAPASWYMSAAAPLPFRTPLFWLMTGFVSLCALALLGAFRLGGRTWSSSFVMTALAVLMTFSWPVLTTIGNDLAATLGIGLIGDVAPVVIAGVALWIGARLTREPAFAIVIGGAITVYAVVLATMALAQVVPAPEPLAVDDVDDTGADVVLLVLDGYGRADVLARNFDADTGAFLDALERRGFFVADDATTNYPFTYAAVSSMLHASYTIDVGPIDEGDYATIREALSGQTGMFREFAAAGYETRYLLNAWAGSHCGGLVDVCVSGGIVGRSLWNLARMSILSPLVDEIWRNPLNDLSAEQLTALGDILRSPSRDGRPIFTFAHIILPHVPLRLAEDCSRTDGGPASEWGSQPELRTERRARYRAQVTCVNTLVLDALDRFLSDHPDAVVMITADHGPGASLNPNHSVETVPDTGLAERIPILSAYRLPGCEDGYRPDITPVNGARAVLRCAIGSEVEPLEDITLWVDFDAEGVATDITTRVRPSP
jgi:hypothetical protein